MELPPREPYFPVMGGWTFVETVRCARCRVFTPENEVVSHGNGRRLCLGCAPLEASSWVAPPIPSYEALRTRGPVRVVAAVMLLLTMAFPFAACVSQL
jgi:hypothetical protein